MRINCFYAPPTTKENLSGCDVTIETGRGEAVIIYDHLNFALNGGGAFIDDRPTPRLA